MDVNAMQDLERISMRKAVVTNNLGTVRALIRAGANINAAVSRTGTPFHLAAKFGYVEMLKALIKAGANVNAENFYKRTPLHVTVDKGNVEIARILLWAGANVDAKDIYKITPLQIAAFNKNVEIVTALVNAGADVNASDRLKRTPLHKAAEKGNSKIIKVLMMAGANANAEDYSKRTPLLEAVEKRNQELRLSGARVIEDLSHNLEYVTLQKFPEKYLSSIRIMIKFSFLYYPSSMNNDFGGHFNFCPELSEACSNEVPAMSKDLITDKVSLHDYLNRNNASHKIQYSIARSDCISDVIFQRILARKYPVYNDILIEELGRSYIEEKFIQFNLCVKLQSLESPQREIILDAFSMQAIAKYLPLYNLAEFVFAFTDLNSRKTVDFLLQ